MHRIVQCYSFKSKYYMLYFFKFIFLAFFLKKEGGGHVGICWLYHLIYFPSNIIFIENKCDVILCLYFLVLLCIKQAR